MSAAPPVGHPVTRSRHPLVQAPMAGAQDEALALAVSACGALGSLPAALLTPEALARQLARLGELRQRVLDAAWNVNFFAHTLPDPDPAREARWRAALRPFYLGLGLDPAQVPEGPLRRPFDAAMAEVLEAAPPAVVSFHFGLPSPDLRQRLRRLGCALWSSATTVDEALWLAAEGVDAVIVQGWEAGGHRGHFLREDLAGQAPLAELLPRVRAALDATGRADLPLVAAGGIHHADEVARALALGAAAVQVGTAYLRCPEARISAVHRAALQQPGAGEQTAVTTLFSGRPARGITNRLMREWGPMGEHGPDGQPVQPPAFPLASTALGPLRAAAEAAGRGDFSPLWAGAHTDPGPAQDAAGLTRSLLAAWPPAAGDDAPQRPVNRA